MAQDSHLLTDLRLRLRDQRFRPVFEVESVLRRLPNRPGRVPDLVTTSGRENLAQAITMRLLTPVGELAELGHPEYGSRLHELIGRQNTETTRNLVRLFILESLQLEPRIAKVVDVVVTPHRFRRELIDVLLRVQPIGVVEIVTIGPFTLEL